ncbi:hypothetical protein BH09BAC3_BH09BAC3_15150 [soil metagenome]
MKKYLLPYLAAAICLLGQPARSQEATDATSLGLPGDNLDLYAVLDLFQKSRTIEDFEKSLNEEKAGINNLDLDLDKKVDFIKVVTKNEGSSFTFVLQDVISEKETQDVAVILVDKDKAGKVTMQIIGDKDLYGKDYVIEPKPPATVNPGYTGAEAVKTTTPTKTIVVESAPIVQYVYSPVYVPYVPPYYYGFYPPYYAPFTVVAFGIYHSNNYYYHGGGYGYHNTTVIVNHNHYNNYNVNRNTSVRVTNNNINGNYNNGNRPSTRPSNGGSRLTTTNARSNGSTSGGGASNSQNNRGGNNNRANNNSMSRPATQQSPSNLSRGGGGRSMGSGGGNRGGAGSAGAGSRGGGGGRRR